MPTDAPRPGAGVASVVGPTCLTESLVDRGRRCWRPGPLLALVSDTAGGGVHVYARRQDRPDRGWDRGAAVSADAVGADISGQPLKLASERYMRNHMDLNVLEENKRFPRGE